MNSFRVPAASLLLALSLAGCGGGGGGAPAPTPTPAPPAPPANIAPVMPAATFNGTEDQDSTGQLAATDANGDVITFAVTTQPTRGTLTAFTAAGAFTYRPNANAFGADTFVVSASDGRGGSASATITLNIAGVDDPLVASHDRVELPYSATLTVNVLANDANADNDATLSIIEPALVGTATVNADNSVSITGLPANFRGLTRFRYRLTDVAGVTSDAVANVFVATDSFRAILRAATTNPQSFDIAITDFTGAPRVLNANPATPADAESVSMRASTDGEVVVYYRTVPNATNDGGQICSMRTAVGSTPQCYDVPDDRILGSLRPNPYTFAYAISPNGRWVAAVLERSDQGFASSLYLIDTQSPTVATAITVSGAEHAVQPVFTDDSQYLYFTGAANLSNDGRGIYRVSLGSSQPPLRMTRVEDPASIVDGFSLSGDGTRLVFQRTGTDAGVWLVETASPGQEHRLSHAFTGGEQLQRLQSQPAYTNATGTSVAYVMWLTTNVRTLYMANVSTSDPNPQLVGFVPNTSTSPVIPMVRPDGQAVAYTWGVNVTANDYRVYEATKIPGTPTALTRGLWGGYSPGGDYLLALDLVYSLPSYTQTNNYTVLARSPAVGAAVVMGSPGMQSRTAAGDLVHPVLLMGESADGFGALFPRLVNYAAPDKVLPLTEAAISVPDADGRFYFIVAGAP